MPVAISTHDEIIDALNNTGKDAIMEAHFALSLQRFTAIQTALQDAIAARDAVLVKRLRPLLDEVEEALEMFKRQETWRTR